MPKASDDPKPATRKPKGISAAERARRAERFPGGAAEVALAVRTARHLQQRAERERVAELSKAEREDEPGLGRSDTGSRTQIKRGRAEVVDAMIPVDPHDNSGPAFRGRRGQRVWVPDRLMRTKAIDASVYYAAVRYLDDYEVGHEGARDRSDTITTRSKRVGPMSGPTDRQLEALRRYQRATQRAGLIAAGVLAWCVLGATPSDEAPTVEAFAKATGLPAAQAMGMLKTALGSIAAFYETVDDKGTGSGGGGGKRRHTIAGHAGHGPEAPPDSGGGRRRLHEPEHATA